MGEGVGGSPRWMKKQEALQSKTNRKEFAAQTGVEGRQAGSLTLVESPQTAAWTEVMANTGTAALRNQQGTIIPLFASR